MILIVLTLDTFLETIPTKLSTHLTTNCIQQTILLDWTRKEETRQQEKEITTDNEQKRNFSIQNLGRREIHTNGKIPLVRNIGVIFETLKIPFDRYIH